MSLLHFIQHCQSVCDRMLTMAASTSGASDRNKQARLLRDCADICGLTAQMLARSSHATGQMLLLCARISERCAEECLKHPDPDSHYCARVCLQNASACRTYALEGMMYRRPERTVKWRDHGKKPFVINIRHAAKKNRTFRTALWTGTHLQVVVMSIDVGEDIGLEVHPDVDQFLRIEQGRGLVQMGARKDQLDFVTEVGKGDAIMVPAGTWHNLTNTGKRPLKLYTIYAPPEHPFGTVHKTKRDAMEAEGVSPAEVQRTESRE